MVNLDPGSLRAFSAIQHNFVSTDSPLLQGVAVSSCRATMSSPLPSCGITRLLRYYWAIRLPVPHCRDRNTARAALSGELPIHAPFRYVQWVPNSTMTHVSASPPFIPEGRISRVRLAATAFPREPSRKIWRLSVRSHTPLDLPVISQARHIL